MAPEFHLAESTLALHLLLQHLEGLVDIVVTNENLHGRSSWSSDLRSGGQGAQVHWCTDMYNSGVDGTHGTNRRRYFKLCRRWALRLPIGRNEDFGSPFLGNSSDSQCLACLCPNGPFGDKEQ